MNFDFQLGTGKSRKQILRLSIGRIVVVVAQKQWVTAEICRRALQLVELWRFSSVLMGIMGKMGMGCESLGVGGVGWVYRMGFWGGFM